jgi:hypothetical protein
VKWIGFAPFSNVQLSSAVATTTSSNPTATRTPMRHFPKIFASTE